MNILVPFPSGAGCEFLCGEYPGGALPEGPDLDLIFPTLALDPTVPNGSGFPKSLPAFGIIQPSHLQSDGYKMEPHSFDLHTSD